MKIYTFERKMNRATLPLEDFAKLCYDDILNYNNEDKLREVTLPDDSKIEEVVLYAGPKTHVRFVAFRVTGQKLNYFAQAPFAGLIADHLEWMVEQLNDKVEGCKFW